MTDRDTGPVRVDELLRPFRFLSPLRAFWLLALPVIVLCHWFAAALQIAALALHPQPPLAPGIVEMRTRLTGRFARALLLLLLAPTPGLLGVDIVNGDARLRVHCLAAGGDSGLRTAHTLFRRLEDAIERITG